MFSFYSLLICLIFWGTRLPSILATEKVALNENNMNEKYISPGSSILKRKDPTFVVEEISKSKSSEFVFLKFKCQEDEKRAMNILGSSFEMDEFQIESLRMTVTETIHTICLSRILPEAERRELLQSSYDTFQKITDYLQSKEPRKYPAATVEEKEELRQMISIMEKMRVDLLRLIYYGRRTHRHASIITERITENLNPIGKRLGGYYTEYDMEYRQAVILESLIFQLIMFIMQGPNDYAVPTGVPLILAEQSKRKLSELKNVFKKMVNENKGRLKLLEINNDIRFEIALLITFEILSGKVSRDTDKILRGIRSEYVRIGVDSDFLTEIFVQRMETRMKLALNSVNHVLEDTYYERLQDGIPNRKKSSKLVRLDTPKKRYFLCYSTWAEEIDAWDIHFSEETETLFDVMDTVNEKISELKTLAPELPQQII